MAPTLPRAPNPARFMGSSLGLAAMPSGHEPENRKCLEIKGAISRFMERFMESHLFLFELPRAHEPGRVGRARQLPQRDRRELWCHRVPGGETGSVDGLLHSLVSMCFRTCVSRWEGLSFQERLRAGAVVH